MTTCNCALESKNTLYLKNIIIWLINAGDDVYNDYDNNNNINVNNAYILRNFCTTYILEGEWQNLYF
jgi:hypothetical protein